MAQNIDRNRNYTDITNIPIFCLPKRVKDFHFDKNIQKFNSDIQLIQKCIGGTDLLESLCYDHNLNLNATKVNEFLSSEHDYVEVSVHASRIPNVIGLEHENNVNEERQDIRTESSNYSRKENQANGKEYLETHLDSPSILQNIPKKEAKGDTNKYMEVNAEIYLNEKTFCYIIDQKIFFHLRNWHYITTTKAGTYCFLCQMYIDPTHEGLKFHIEGQEHLENLELVKKRVLAEFGNSMVTEISSKTYHCGVCTIVLKSINSVRSHCSNRKHVKGLESRMNRAQRFLAARDKERLTNINTDNEANNNNQIGTRQKSSLNVTHVRDESNKFNGHSLSNTTETKKDQQSDCRNDASGNRYMEVNVEITAKKGFYHCGVCNVIIHTLPGMRKHCRTQGHLEDYERLTTRAQRFLGEATIPGHENGTTKNYVPSMNEPKLNLRSHESCDLSKKYMTICSVKKDHASFLINKKIALVRAHWHGFPRQNGQYYCVLCRTDFSKMGSHMKDRGHKQRMQNKVGRILAEFGYGMVCETPVKNLYHCAVCNVTIQGISAVRAHSVIEKHLLRIEKNMGSAKKILERVPRINFRNDCVLRRGSFYDARESDSSTDDDYVDVGVSMRSGTSGGAGSASDEREPRINDRNDFVLKNGTLYSTSESDPSTDDDFVDIVP